MCEDADRSAVIANLPATSEGFGYSELGGVDRLRKVATPIAAPGHHEVQVRIVRSGVNPTDVKARKNFFQTSLAEGEVQVPHHDGAGVVTAVGAGVSSLRVGQRVWTHLAAYRRTMGTAQQYANLPESHVSPLPDAASFELGASLGVPFITAHRLLTLHQDAPIQLQAGSLAGLSVLVAGGAGVVGNATIQLARWAGATVLTSVSSAEKAKLAEAAGAHHVLNYREEDIPARVRAIVPSGVDIIVEVSPAVNAATDIAALAVEGCLNIYANDGGPRFDVPVLDLMWLNATANFVILYTLRTAHLTTAAAAVTAAVDAGAVGVGVEHGLSIHTYALEDVAAAHVAVESGIVGKVQVAIEHP